MVLLLVLAAAVAGAAFALWPHVSADPTASDSSATATISPTPTAPSDSAVAGDRAIAATSPSPSPFTIKAEPSRVASDAPRATKPGAVQVVLTYAGFQDASRSVQANGFVAGVIQDGGTCTLTLTHGSDVVTAQTTAGADATTTSCGLLETRAGLTPGVWTAVLSYASSTARGQSQPLEVTTR